MARIAVLAFIVAASVSAYAAGGDAVTPVLLQDRTIAHSDRYQHLRPDEKRWLDHAIDTLLGVSSEDAPRDAR